MTVEQVVTYVIIPALLIAYGLSKVWVRRENTNVDREKAAVAREQSYVTLVNETIKRMALMEIKNDALLKDNMELRVKNDELSDKLDNLTSRLEELEKLKQSLQEKDVQIASLRSRVGELEKANEKLIEREKEIIVLRRRIAELEKEVESLRQQLARYEKIQTDLDSSKESPTATSATATSLATD